MAVVARDTSAASGAGSHLLLRRPPWLFSVLLDCALGVCVYLASYWLRFEGERFATFLPTAWSTTPVVVGGQLAALAAVRAYAPRPRASWLFRVVAGIVLGTAASSIVIRLVMGFEGVSRMAFVADALLFSIAAIGWRGAWVLRARSRARAAAGSCGQPGSGEDLVDRADEMTLGTVVTQPLPLPRAAEEPRPQGPQAEVPRLGVRLPLVAGQPAADDRRLHVAFTFILRIRSEMVRVLPDARPAVVDVLRQLRHDVDRGDRRQRRPAEERVLSAGDSADRHGAVQPRAVPADRVACFCR